MTPVSNHVRSLDVRRLRVGKKSLRGEQKVSDAFVADARTWANALVAREHRGPGDTVDAAMWRAEQRYGIERSTFWSLRYRPPKDIVVGVYMRLKAAYEHECERQEARLAHELMLTKAAGRDATNSAAVREAEALLCEKEELK
jgi:hypothetical protein